MGRVKRNKATRKTHHKEGNKLLTEENRSFFKRCRVVLASFLQVSFTKYSAMIVCLITRLNVAFYGSFLLTFYFI